MCKAILPLVGLACLGILTERSEASETTRFGLRQPVVQSVSYDDYDYAYQDYSADSLPAPPLPNGATETPAGRALVTEPIRPVTMPMPEAIASDAPTEPQMASQARSPIPEVQAGSNAGNVSFASDTELAAETSETRAMPCVAPRREPWTLPQPCFLQRNGIKAGGWLEQGITFNGNNPTNGFNGPLACNDLDSEFQINQLWLYLAKPVNTGGCGWDIGGQFDIIWGTDARFGANFGFEDKINGDRNTYGFVIPQMYLEVGYNDLSVKLGHFAGILDYEAVPAVANQFYSHSYSYSYSAPMLVTGVAADYKLTNQVTLQAGFHRGPMMFEDNNDSLDFMGGAKWVSCDKRTSLAYGLSTGADPMAANRNTYMSSLVFQHQLTQKTKYVAVHNLGVTDQHTIVERNAEWYGLNQYFLHTINKCWAANLRVEWFRDDDGTRIGGPGLLGRRGYNGTGFAGDFYEISTGLNWRPKPNITVRPELRWDWYAGPDGNIGQPFNDGNSDHQFTFGTDVIWTF